MAGAPGYFLTAAQAAAALGVTRATLYAYASRRQLRSQAVGGTSRERRYYREDIDRLKERRSARRDPAGAAARGLHWGGPVLESGITLIHDGRLFYRGRDVEELAKTMTAEEVAALLWMPEGHGEDGAHLFAQSCPLPRTQLTALRKAARDPITRLQAALPLA